MPTLPDVTAKFKVDYSSLTAAEKASAKAHGEFQAGAKASTTHTLRFEQSLTTMTDRFGSMPPVVNQAARSLESMASQGVTGMTLIGGAALAGFGIVVEGAHMALDSYVHLGEQVENYKRVVGGTAEDAGRAVQAFQALGVSEEVATGAMFKLSKASDQHEAKLNSLGIEVARDAEGNTNLSKTLFSVADAYNATADQGKKNAIVLAAFGKTGKDMIPILEQGSEALRQLEESARLTFTDEDLQRLKQMKIHQAEVKQGWDAMWESLGQKLIPAQDALAQAFLRSEYEQKRLDEAVAKGQITMAQYHDTTGHVTEQGLKLRDQWDKQYDASQKVKSAIDAQTQATQDAAAANEKLWASTDKLITQEEAQVNAEFALRLADLAIAESQGKVDQAHQRVVQSANRVEAAQDALRVAQQSYGASSEQARLATDNLRTAQLEYGQIADDVTKAEIEQEKSYYAAAAAARKLQQDTDLATTGQKDAAKETDAYIAKLQAEANTLAPDSALRKRLQEYIDKLRNEIPAEVTTRFKLLVDVRSSGQIARELGYAEGGRPPVGRDVWVGEYGPERVRFDQPATVYPQGQAALSGASLGGGDTNVYVTVQGSIMRERDLALSLRESLRRLDREER